MQQACQIFIGQHDFSAFCANKNMKKSTVRHIHSIIVERVGDEIQFTVTGNGFLHHMVRIMVGTLLDIEKGKINESTVPWIINLRERKNAGATARPDGLYLKKVYYK